MSIGNIIEQSIKNLDTLPATVRTNMMEIRRLDAMCQKMTLETQTKVRQLIDSWKSINKEARKKSFNALKVDFRKMRELSDEKIRISEQTYELVDKYIIKLDNDTAKLNSTVRRKVLGGGGESSATVDHEPEVIGRKRRGTMPKKEGKRMKKTERAELTNQDAEPFGISSTPLVDMPVDPNEPTYCVCRQVSFGQMVMCDNKNCPIEWFHFQCVGLTTKPRGKWYCESCSEGRRKKA